MGQYLTYNDFLALGGKLDLVPFNLLEFNNRKEIDEITHGRLINLGEQSQEVKYCVFNLIMLDLSINNGVETSGNAINYSIEEIKQQKINIIMRDLSNCYLSDWTPYLYSGL